MRFSFLLFLALLGLITSPSVYAKSRGSVVYWQQGHSQDMAQVMGVTQDSPLVVKQRWEKITAVFAECIDDRSDAAACNRMITQMLPAFNWHDYGHRIFFHWGFNSFPPTVADFKKDVSNGKSNCENALVCCIEEALQAEPEEKRNQLRKQVWDRLRFSQSMRNNHMMRAIPAADRDTKNAIAAILYDVHLLGDYIVGTEETSKALYPIFGLQRDIVRAVNRIRVKDDTAKKNLVKSLNAIKINGDAYMPKAVAEKQAQQLLQVLITQFPEVIRQSPSYKSLMGE